MVATEHRDGLRIGELAQASGLSIRTVRYYDQIGLLTPSRRSGAGHRLYDKADVRRLYRICLLRRTGLPLVEIARALDEPDWQLHRALPAHLQMLDHQLAVAGALRRRVAAMVTTLGSADGAPTTAQFLETMEEMAMLDHAVQRRISILVYEDIAAMHAWLIGVFGLGAGRLDHDEHGHCVHGEVNAGDGVIWLHQVSPDWAWPHPRPSASPPRPPRSWSRTSTSTTDTLASRVRRSSTRPPTSPTATASTAPEIPRAACGRS